MAASVSSGAGAGAGAGADKKQRLGESVGRLTSELDLMKRLLADYMDRGGLPGGEFVGLVLIWRSCMATDDRLLSSSQLSSSQASSAFVWCLARVGGGLTAGLGRVHPDASASPTLEKEVERYVRLSCVMPRGGIGLIRTAVCGDRSPN